MSPKLTVYGAAWCGDTRYTRAFLDQQVIAYTYVELEDAPQAAAWVQTQNDGAERKPTLRLVRRPQPDAVLAVPTNDELRAWLTEHRVKGAQ